MTAEIAELYGACRNDLLNYLSYKLRCRETAEDLTQEAFLIYSRTSETAKIESPRSFLFRTATNLAVDHIRHQKVVDRHVEAALHYPESFQTEHLEQQISATEWQDLLLKTLNQLSSRTRDIIILNRLHGLSYKQIAQTCNLSESAVEKHISRGLQHCQQVLGSVFLIKP
jgi:RNA polymerase sigma factor (sigma-70 family)